MQLFQEETIGREVVSESENGVRHRSQTNGKQETILGIVFLSQLSLIQPKLPLLPHLHFKSRLFW